MITMRQKEGQPMQRVEYFYDGQLPVENDGVAGKVTFDEKKKAHWIQILLQRNYRIVDSHEEAPLPEE